MDKIERVTAVIEGRQPDRPPVSFWYHFGPEQVAGPPAIEAHVQHLETYDLDFLKIMDDNRYPRTGLPNAMIAGAEDLDRLTVLSGDEDSFGQQLELIGGLAERVAGQVRMPTTIFSAWGTLRQMAAPPSDKHGPPTLRETADPRDALMSRFLRASPQALENALNVIAESLANFARHCLAAGADGVFLSVRDDWVEMPDGGGGAYDRLVRPTDLKILAGADRGTFNMLHVCGKAVNFARFSDYPVHVINWADRYAGPTIAEVAESIRPAICGGLDNLGTMVTGSPQACAEEVADALRQAGGRPMIIAPGCTFDPAAVPAENLHAIRRAVEHATA
jgi:uroporphyrinogen decarboxylase